MDFDNVKPNEDAELCKVAGLQAALALEKFRQGAAAGWFVEEWNPLLLLDPQLQDTGFSKSMATTGEHRLLSQLSHLPLGFRVHPSFSFHPLRGERTWVKYRLCGQAELGSHPGSGSSLLGDLQQFA